MYPQVKNMIMKEGKLFAFPEEMNIPILGYSEKIFTETGLQVPASWMEMMALFAQWGESYGQAYPEYTLLDTLYFNRPAEGGSYLLGEMVAAYMDHRLLTGEGLDFDTPLFRQLLTAYETDKPSIDFINDDRDGSTITISNRLEPTSLFQRERDLVPGAGIKQLGSTPLPLSLTPDEETVLGAKLRVYVMNPYSVNKQWAFTFLESLAENMPGQKRLAFYPDENRPVVEEMMQTFVQRLEEELAELEAALEEAKEEDRQLIKEQIDLNKASLEEAASDPFYWQASPQEVDGYHQYAGRWGGVDKNNFPLFSPGASETVRSLRQVLSEYSHGALDQEELIKTFNEKTRMIEMESR